MYRKKLLLTVLCLTLAAVLLASGTMAWLGKTQRADGIYTTLSDFEVTGTLTFADDKPYTGDKILVPVSFDPLSPLYLGSMKYVITYTGVSPAYIRVRVLEQWTDPSANEVLPVSFLDYHITGATAATGELPPQATTIPAAGSNKNNALAETGQWLDSRGSDYCYYYSIPVQPKALVAINGVSIADGAVTLTLIDQTDPLANNDGMLAGLDPTSIQCSLAIEVEAVQPNRIREFWGIEAIPTVS